MPLDTTVSQSISEELLIGLQGRTVMLVGGPGVGKTTFSRSLASALVGSSSPAALVCTDMGQQSVGVPTCMGLALGGEPWRQVTAMWFVGDTSPRGNLLPTVVGAARLVEFARAKGARTVVLDTTGLIIPQLGPLLKYHKALAAGVEAVVAIQRDLELEPILAVLSGICPRIYRLAPAGEAHDRTAADRAAYRQQRYREHLRDGQFIQVPAGHVIDFVGRREPGKQPVQGEIVGLLDATGFCQGLGLIEDARADWLTIYTAWRQPEAVVRVQRGKVRLDRHADFGELQE